MHLTSGETEAQPGRGAGRRNTTPSLAGTSSVLPVWGGGGVNSDPLQRERTPHEMSCREHCSVTQFPGALNHRVNSFGAGQLPMLVTGTASPPCEPVSPAPKCEERIVGTGGGVGVQVWIRLALSRATRANSPTAPALEGV